jgi:hypothetical protein
MRRTAGADASTAPGGVLLRLRSLLTRPIRLERRGIDWHFVFEPLPRAAGVHRTTEPSARRRGTMPSMTARQVAEVCADLRTVLGGDVGRNPRRPSLALLERALVKDGVRGIDDVPACVLRHAAQSLDTLEIDQYGSGLVELRRRIEQVLRRRHGDRRSREPVARPIERAAVALAAGGSRDFSDSLTEFIDLDRMFGDAAR